jgi:hypothetical protein
MEIFFFAYQAQFIFKDPRFKDVQNANVVKMNISFVIRVGIALVIV